MRRRGKKHEVISLSESGIRQIRSIANIIHPTSSLDPEYALQHLSLARTYATLASVRNDKTICVTIDGMVVIVRKDSEISVWARNMLRRAAGRHRDWSETHGYRYEQLLLALDEEIAPEHRAYHTKEQPDAESQAV